MTSSRDWLLPGKLSLMRAVARERLGVVGEALLVAEGAAQVEDGDRRRADEHDGPGRQRPPGMTGARPGDGLQTELLHHAPHSRRCRSRARPDRCRRLPAWYQGTVRERRADRAAVGIRCCAEGRDFAWSDGQGQFGYGRGSL